MKKRLLTVVLMLCMAVCLCACGGNGSDKDTQKNNTENSQQDDSQANKDTENEDEDTNVDDDKIEYTVKVVDANGAPVAGKQVQVCDEANCSLPAVTDANGVAVIRFEQSNECKAKIIVPYGQEDVYEYVYFEAGSTEITLVAAE